MTNVSNEKQQKQATTLDKIWKRLKTVDEDIEMKDTEEKEPPKLMDNSTNEGNETNKQTTPYDNYTPTKEMFPMALRFKISSKTEEDTHNKHINVLQAELRSPVIRYDNPYQVIVLYTHGTLPT